MSPTSVLLLCVVAMALIHVVTAFLIVRVLHKQHETHERVLDCFEALQISIGNSIIEGTL